jgi:hypothetical protein
MRVIQIVTLALLWIWTGASWAQEGDASAAATVGDAEPIAGDAAPSMGSTRAMAGHIMVEAAERTVRVVQVYVVVFGSEVSGGGGDEPWIALPEEATSITVDRGEEIIRAVPGGVALIGGGGAAGRQAIALSFTVPAEEGRAVIAHQLPFSVGAVHVMWPASAPYSAQAMGFEDRGVIEMGPRPMRVLERAEFPADGRLVIVTTDRPSAPPEAREAELATVDPLGRLPWLTLVVAILAMLVSALVPLRRPPAAKP